MSGSSAIGSHEVGFGFLNLPEEHQRPGSSRVHVLPVPLEETVSYGGGTRRGPRAIIDASVQVELYDRAFGGEPALGYGIHTLPAVPVEPGPIEAVLDRVQAAVAAIRAAGKLPVVLGGEHTVTIGPVRALHMAARLAGGGPGAPPLAVVQVDAHADLRDTYGGSPFSHACVMRRLVEETGCELYQVGIRSLSAEEHGYLRAHPSTVRTFFADEIHADAAGAWLGELAVRLAGRRVYLTVDVDGLDPSIVPATGTPEPGGLTWSQATALLDAAAGAAAEVVGIDCVELAPRPGMHAADFAAAKLLYRAISAAMQPRPAGAGRRRVS